MCNLTDYKNMWVFIETECGKAKNVGYELLNEIFQALGIDSELV